MATLHEKPKIITVIKLFNCLKTAQPKGLVEQVDLTGPVKVRILDIFRSRVQYG